MVLMVSINCLSKIITETEERSMKERDTEEEPLNI